MTSQYAITLHDHLIHDRDDATNREELSAMVASGDCFVTLATQLDAVAHQVPTGQAHDSLDRVIGSLMELQRRYRIVSKLHDYRQ